MSNASHLLRPYLTRHWPALGIAALASLMVAAAELARPIPLALAIDHLIGAAAPGGFDLGSEDVKLLAGLGLLVVVVAGASALANYLADVALRQAGERITHELRTVTHAHLQRLSLAFHDRRHTGDLVTRVTGDVNAVGALFSESLGTIVQSLLLLLGMLVVSLIIDPVMALAAFAMSPVLALVTVRFRRRLKAAARRQRAHEGEIAALTAESFASMREVKASGSEGFEHDRLARKSEERREAGMDTYLIEGRFAGAIDLLAAVGSALVLVIGVLRVASGAVSVGELVIMHSYVRRLNRPLRDLARQAGRISRAMARAERVAAVLAEETTLEERQGAFTGGRARGDLELESVSFGYGERAALHDVSLRVAAGERVTIAGPSGAGKSTVAALVARFYDPASGRVLLDGRDARDCSTSWYRRQVGLVLQETVLFTGTVADNISYGQQAEREHVVAVAKAAGAHEFIRALPEGYETALGPRGAALSGGERQRIAIARVLLRDPPVLVMDEPTAGLDADTEARVIEGLETLMRGRTTLIITHSPSLAAAAGRVVVIDDGQVKRDGPALEADRRPPARRRGIDRPVPRDPALPQLETLLDPAAMAPVLQRSLGTESPPEVAVRYLRYKPATNLVVDYEVEVSGRRYRASAMIAARGVLARRAAKPEHTALARQVNGRSPAASPLAYEADLGAMVQWLPLDIALPALGTPAGELRRELRCAGLVGPEDCAEPELLAYKPRRRAVVRLDGHVLKLYANEAEFEHASTALRTVTRATGIRTAGLAAVLPALRATAQTALEGRTPRLGAGAARKAGDTIAGLHRRELGPLPAAPPARQLEAALASARLVRVVCPELDLRIVELAGRLAASRPPALELVPSHGDFSPHQLLEVGRSLALIDFDELCAAPPALDLATYASYLVADAAGDLDAVEPAMDALLEGYARRPADLPWYLATSLLRRAPAPFRRQEEDWPTRVEAMLRAADSALAR